MLRRKMDVTGFKEEVDRLRKSRLAVILLVYFALVMDNMLLTVVVPIIPDYLYQMEYHPSEKMGKDAFRGSTNSSSVPKVLPLESLPFPANAPKGVASDLHSPINELPETFSASDSEMRSRGNDHTLTLSRSLISYDPKSAVGHTSGESSGISHPHDSSSGRPPEPNDRDKFQFINHKDSEGSKVSQIDIQSASHAKRAEMFHVRSRRIDVTEYMKTQYLKHLKRRKRGSSDNASSKRNKQSYIEANFENPQDVSLRKATFSSSSLSSSFQPKAVSVRSTSDYADNESPSFEILSSEVGLKSENVTRSFKGTAIAIPNIQEENTSQTNQSYADKLPQDIINENGRVGLLFSSKAFVQLIVNPFIGPLTSRIGYSLPLLFGTHNLILSALLFAYAESYTLLFVARSIQGIASSCIAISGMGMIAECYPEDRERGRVQGMVMGGIALGVLAGYPLGGLLYDFTNSKAPPFLLVAVLTVILALLQLAVLDPRPVPDRLVVATPIGGLIRDPYILITAGAVMVSTSAMAVLEPCLPIWLTDTLHPKKWQLGTAFIPDSLGYLVGTSCTAGPAYKIGRWRASVIAIMMVAFAAAAVPEAGSMMALAGPHFFLGMGVGTVDAAMMPLLAAIVDTRHVAAYGAVYAIAQGAVAMAYGFGPLVGGAVVRHIGFPWLMRGVAILNLCYCPLLFALTNFIHDPSETQAILMAAPDPNDYTSHTTSSVQPREASLRYQQLFNEEED